ncbi:hypothetical protein A3B20_04210 [Candidatus Uhrbacteria bacterium RIFCSPLOWO2_01_FULL_47_17]|nr:MAG: hypothetical protein A3B20_04210 [Candidatus Uhrbacteria bacterium RIFCSPLOWO2_01_FULL_47_17]
MEVDMGLYTRYNTKSQPPPGLDKILKKLAKHSSVKRDGFVRWNEFRSLAQGADNEYKERGPAKELRDFLTQTSVLLAEGSEKYYFDPERGEVILRCCGLGTEPPNATDPIIRMRFLKCRPTLKAHAPAVDAGTTTQVEDMDPSVVDEVARDADEDLVLEEQDATDSLEDTTEGAVDPVSTTELEDVLNVPSQEVLSDLVALRHVVRCNVSDAQTLLDVIDGHVKEGLTRRLGQLYPNELRGIGLLIKQGDRVGATWSVDPIVLKQCRFEFFPRKIHRHAGMVEKAPGTFVSQDAWRHDLEQIARRHVEPPEETQPLERGESTVQDSTPDVKTAVIPIQYDLLGKSPKQMTDVELEEGMLAALALAATIQNKHAEMVAKKEHRAEVRQQMTEAQTEKDRLERELADLQALEKELKESRAAADSKIAALRQRLSFV